MDHERELLRLWSLVSDIIEQLNHNKAITSKLQADATQLRDTAGHTANASTLRRFNADISKATFSSELERLSVALVMENQTLLHENKQLNTLLQEYEQTLDTVLSKFRGHAYAAQTHQSNLNRHYETLLSRDLEDAPDPHGFDPSRLNNLIALTRAALRSLDGKDPQDAGEMDAEEEAAAAAEETGDDEIAPGDWVLEREKEILRLEKQNVELRRALGISPDQDQEHGFDVADKLFIPQQIHSTAQPSPPLRDDRLNSRGGGGRTGFGPPRRPGVPIFNRRAGGVSAAQDRVMSPPNDVQYGQDGQDETPSVDSI